MPSGPHRPSARRTGGGNPASRPRRSPARTPPGGGASEKSPVRPSAAATGPPGRVRDVFLRGGRLAVVVIVSSFPPTGEVRDGRRGRRVPTRRKTGGVEGRPRRPHGPPRSCSAAPASRCCRRHVDSRSWPAYVPSLLPSTDDAPAGGLSNAALHLSRRQLRVDLVAVSGPLFGHAAALPPHRLTGPPVRSGRRGRPRHRRRRGGHGLPLCLGTGPFCGIEGFFFWR